MNIIFQENLNEMIHHAQQKISNTFCHAPAPSQAAPRPRLRFGDLQSPWLAAPEETSGDRQREALCISKRTQQSRKANRFARKRAAAFLSTAASYPPRTGSTEHRDNPRFIYSSKSGSRRSAHPEIERPRKQDVVRAGCRGEGLQSGFSLK